jgi:1-acyl-sn-glycerol-3-phosphate acyltransferase
VRHPSPAEPFSPTGLGADLFRDRLSALEEVVEQALAKSGGGPGASGRMVATIESVLDAYARATRSLEESWWASWIPGLARRPWRGEVDAFGHDPAFERSVAPFFRLLYRSWWRVEVAGLENVPATGRALLVANHAGGLFAYDAAMVQLALREEHPAHRLARPLLDELAHQAPLLEVFMRRCGAVRASAAHAESLLRDDQLVIAFPEGVHGIGKLYRRRYRLARFGHGAFVRAALRTGSPILPVAVVGAEEIHPVIGQWGWLSRQLGLSYFPITPTFPWLGTLGLVPLPSRWRIEFGTPIDWSAHRGAEAAEDRRLISRLAASVRHEIQRLLAGALDRRGPAFWF